MKPFEIISFDTPEALAREVAKQWLAKVAAAQEAGKSHSVALSGGRIALALFASTAEQARTRGVPVQQAHFFWADERCVPPDDPESNFRVAHELLFAPLGVPQSQIHRVRGEDPPEQAAAQAEADMRRIVPVNSGNQPVLDLVLLGMGEDGHVASLSPAEPEELRVSKAVYRAVRNFPKPPPTRVTLGYPAIAAAAEVWVLVSGSGKEKAFRDSLDLSGRTPLGRVLKLRPHSKIFTDIRLG